MKNEKNGMNKGTAGWLRRWLGTWTIAIMSVTFAGHAALAPLVFAAAPFSVLTDLAGRPATLDSKKDHRLVVFWGTWCEECRSKLGKELLELDRRADVSVVTVNVDRDDERVREFVLKEGIRLPVLRDPSKEFRRGHNAFSVPHWALYRRVAGGYELVSAEPAFDYTHIVDAIAATRKGEVASASRP